MKIYNHEPIFAASHSREDVKNLVRVKSSNVWARSIDIKDRKAKYGNVYVQFKDKNGGPGHIYIYYDVPINVYRRWLSATSVGHYFWMYIRNNYKYSKLTGDKRTKLKNGINH